MHPASAEYTLTQWNQLPVLDPSPAVFGHTKIVRMIGSTMNSTIAARLLERAISLASMRAATTATHMSAEYQGMDSNRNISSLAFGLEGTGRVRLLPGR